MYIMKPAIRNAFGALAIGAASVSAGCAPAVSVQDEVQLGRETAAQINSELPLVQDAASLQYLNQLGTSIASRADTRGIPYRFYIVNAPEVNAFAIPGGHIYINRGLIERAANVSELAGVLAHEIAHVTHRHGIDQWQRAQNANLGLAVLYGVLLGRNPSGVEQVGIQIAGTGYFSGHSREAEREADISAIQYLINSGIHPGGLVTMFETLLAERQRNPGALEQWFSTHPTTQERIDNTRTAINQIGANRLQGLTTNSQAFTNFRSRVSGLPATARR